MELFDDRAHAGRRLAAELADLAGRDDLLVLGLPRGGVPVAAEVARALQAPLDVLLVRKLGVPGHEELAMGAIAGGVQVVNEEVVRAAHVGREEFEAVAARERAELERRRAAYRPGPPAEVAGRCVVVVDDGLATGSTMEAAVGALRAAGAGRVVAAVPVAAPEACDRLAGSVDRLACPVRPSQFRSVGAWYRDFRQVDDAQVAAALREA